MFFRKKQKEKPVQESKVDLSSYKTQVMPEQFLPERTNLESPKPSREEIYLPYEEKSKGVNTTKLVGGIIIALAGLGIIGGIFYLYQSSLGRSSKEENTPSVVKQNEIPVKPSNENQNASKETEEKKEEPKEEVPVKPEKTEELEPEENGSKEELPSIQLIAGPDADSDGLSDIEEDLYKTDKDKKDTDGDGYSDGEEILNHYDPSGAGQLEGSKSELVKVLHFGPQWEFLYPLQWKEQNSTGKLGVDNLFLTTNSQAIFQISFEQNPDKLSLDKWFELQNPGNGVIKYVPVQYGDFFGIRTDEGPTVYLTHKDNPETILVFFYNPVDSSLLHYLTTFEMMLKSLRVAT